MAQAIGFNQLRKQLAQYEATTGRPAPPGVFRDLAEAELSNRATRATGERALDLRERALNEDIRAGKEAAKASGITQLAGTAVTAGMLLKGTELGSKVGLGAATTTAPATAAPATGSAAAGGTAAAGLSAKSAGLAAAAPESVGTGFVASGSSATGASLASFSYAAPVFIGGLAGGMLAEKIGVDKKLGGTLGGAAVGGYIMAGTSIGGPVGALVGAAVGFVANASVICSELCRQGYLDKRILLLDSIYRHEHISTKAYDGYTVLAGPVVKLMQKSKLATRIIAPLGRAWAYEMASQVDPGVKGNRLGRIIFKLGLPLCELVGRNEAWAFSKA